MSALLTCSSNSILPNTHLQTVKACDANQTVVVTVAVTVADSVIKEQGLTCNPMTWHCPDTATIQGAPSRSLYQRSLCSFARSSMLAIVVDRKTTRIFAYGITSSPSAPLSSHSKGLALNFRFLLRIRTEGCKTIPAKSLALQQCQQLWSQMSCRCCSVFCVTSKPCLSVSYA